MTAAGALAGAVSAIVFVVVHDLLISDIWDMAIVMALAGAACGALLAWAYVEMTGSHSVGRWFRFTGTLVGLLAVIPVLSALVFDPIVSFEEVVSLDGPPGDLIGRALPFTVIVTIAIVLVVTAGFGSLRKHLLPAAIAITVLMLLLGLNLTVVGFVEFTGTEIGVVVEFVGYVVLLGAVYAVLVPALDRRS